MMAFKTCTPAVIALSLVLALRGESLAQEREPETFGRPKEVEREPEE